MFKHLRKMYWKSRDHGHEIRFMLITMILLLGVIAGAGVITCGALGISVTISKSAPESDPKLASQSESEANEVEKPDGSGNPVASGSATTLSASGSASAGYMSTAEADQSTTATFQPSTLPGQISSPAAQTTTPTETSVDVSSLEQLLSFMSDSAYEDLKSQVVNLALSKGCQRATLLSDYQDAGESDFDVIKYVALEDGSVLSCQINLDRGGVNVSLSNKTEAVLEKEAKAKEKAAKSVEKKKKSRGKKSKSKKSKHKRSKKHRRSKKK